MCVGRLGIAGERRLGDLGGAQRCGRCARRTGAAGAARSARSRCSRCGRSSSAGRAARCRAGRGSGLWPHSPAIACAPVSGRPSITTPPPTPVPRMTPNTMRAAGGRAVARLGHGKAVGVVGQPHLAAERALEVALERPAVQARRVGVLDQAGGRRDRAGMGDADACSARRPGARARRSTADDRLDVVLVGAWPASARAGARVRRRRCRAPGPRSWCRRDRCRFAWAQFTENARGCRGCS